MKANPGNLPRYLPTLTEVVAPVSEIIDMHALEAQPAPEQAHPISSVHPALIPTLIPTLIPITIPTPPPAPALDTDAVVERVMQRLAPVLQAKLSEIVANLIEQEIRALQPRLLQEVELMARESMAQALADELDVKPER